MSYKSLFCLIIACLVSLNSHCGTGMKISIDQNNLKSEIKISGTDDLKSAVFIRDNKIWFVSDERHDIHFEGLSSRFKIFTKFEKLQDDKTIFYFQIDYPEKYEISMLKSEHDTIIRITPYDPSITPEELISSRSISRHVEDNKNIVEVSSYEKNPTLIRFNDPFIGDQLFIVPEADLARSNSYSFIDFKILPSLSGIVIRSLSDSLKVQTSINNINISSKTYLNISSASRADNVRIKILSDVFDTSSILDIKKYEVVESLFNSTLANIYESISAVHDNVLKSYKFINLALFFMANNWYFESKSVFELVHNSSDVLDKVYQLKFLIGANYLMCRDFIEAYKIIDSIDIDQVQMKDRAEVRFWKNLTTVAYSISTKNSFDKEFIELLLRRVIKKCVSYKSNFLSSYPPQLLHKVFFQILDLSVNINKASDIKLLTEIMSKIKLEKHSQDLLQYYSTQALLASGYEKQATEKLEECSSSTDLYLYSHCKFELLKASFKNNKISKAEYINGLQSLSTVWRGDKFEVAVLETLADTYMKTNDVANAIRTWRIITSSNPSSYNSFSSYAKAGKVFVDFLQNKLDSNRALDKLAFFYEFKDLIPLGETGDIITIDAATYMLELGLIEQGGKVMEYQVKNRLLGITKEKTINELANVYIASKNFTMAEKVIVDSTVLPFNTINPIISERKYLYIDTLIGNNQYQDAVALSYGDNSVRADELRAKAYFNLEDWDGFNDNSEPYMYILRFTKKNVGLVDDDYIKLLRQNISYFNNNQMQLLDDLYLDIKPRLKKGQKNAERNKIFYNLANDLKTDNLVITKDRREKINTLINQIMNS